MEVVTFLKLLVLQGCFICGSLMTTPANNKNNNNGNSENCIIDVKTLSFVNFFVKLDGSQNGTLEIIRTVKIKPQSKDTIRCIFDVAQLLEGVPEDELLILYTAFSCPENSNFQLILENPSGKRNKDVIGFLFSSCCNLYWKHAAVYGNSVDLKVLHFDRTKDQYEEEKLLFGAVPNISRPYDAGLENIAVLGLSTNSATTQVPQILVEYAWHAEEVLLDGYFLRPGDFYWRLIHEAMGQIVIFTSQSPGMCTCLPEPLPFYLYNTGNPFIIDRYSDIFGMNYYRFMDMKHNDITNLKEFQFMGLIQQISLRETGLKQLGTDTFRFIYRLQNLNLSRNKLETLPTEVFYGLKFLLHLNLEHNMLSCLDALTFRDLPSLQTLSLSHNKLTTFELHLFYRDLPSLQSLLVASNDLTLIDDYAVSGRHDKLSTVDFAKNKLTSIPMFLFMMRGLVNIDLSDNQITFDSFHRLADIINPTFLTNSHRQSVGPNSGNVIQVSKKFVSLQRNNITTLPTHIFSRKHNKTLSSLLFFFRFDVTENPISCDCNSFSFYQYLLPGSQSKQVNPLPQDHIDPWKCDSPNSVKGLQIVDVPATTFRCSQNFSDCPERCTCYQRSVDQVVEVDCRTKRITQIPEKVPKGTEVLYLDRNEISKIPTNYSYFSNLRNLTLSYNNVSKISDSIVKSFTNLSHLELNNNRLQYLPKALTELDLETISLRNNPLVCDCRSKWVKYWLLSKRHAITNIEDILCTSGKAHGKRFVEARDGEFVCEISTEGKVAISLAIFIIVVMVVVCVTFRFRGEIKLLLYVHFNWHPFDKSDDQECDKLYDAFVSYSGIDHRWVCLIFRKQLEHRDPPYRLCLHDRDFIPGHPIQENIKNAIDNSRRMIVILSKNYIQSDWCLYEFRAAHHKVMKERCNFLIVIKFSDVFMNDLDEDLQLYLRTNTYLDVNNKWFWKKLFYTLPQNPLSILKQSDQQEPEIESTSPLFVPASLPIIRTQQQPVSLESNRAILSDTLEEEQPSMSRTRFPSGQMSVVLVPLQQTGDRTSGSTAGIPYQMDLCSPWPANNYIQATGEATVCQANGYIPFPCGSLLPDEDLPLGYQNPISEIEDGRKDSNKVHINVDGAEGRLSGNNIFYMGVVNPSTTSPTTVDTRL